MSDTEAATEAVATKKRTASATKPVHLPIKTAEVIRKYAEKHSTEEHTMTMGEAAEHLVDYALNRKKALAKYAKNTK